MTPRLCSQHAQHDAAPSTGNKWQVLQKVLMLCSRLNPFGSEPEALSKTGHSVHARSCTLVRAYFIS